jgi:hypothetical protein
MLTSLNEPKPSLLLWLAQTTSGAEPERADAMLLYYYIIMFLIYFLFFTARFFVHVFYFIYNENIQFILQMGLSVAAREPNLPARIATKPSRDELSSFPVLISTDYDSKRTEHTQSCSVLSLTSNLNRFLIWPNRILDN